MGFSKQIWTRIGPLNLNVWFMIVGPSGIANKTTPLKYHVRPMIEEMEQLIKESGEEKSLFMPSRFSIEGFIEYLAKYSDEGIIIRDEFTSAFKDMQKDYLADLAEFLSECYDCSVQKRFTRASKLEQSKQVYVNLLAATTPYLYNILKYDWWYQGLGNRIMFIVQDPQLPHQENPEDFFQKAQGDEQNLREIRHNFATQLLAVRKSSTRIIQPSDVDAKALVDFKYEIDQELYRRYEKDQYDILCSYMARMPEMAYKLTALHFLSRKYKEIPNMHMDLWITDNYTGDSRWAIAKVCRHFEYFKKMLEVWRHRPETFVAKTMDVQTGTIMDYLDSHPMGISWSELRSEIRWPNDVMGRTINLLVDTKQVRFFQKKPESGAGRPTTILVSSEKFNKDPKELGWLEVDLDWSAVRMILRL